MRRIGLAVSITVVLVAAFDASARGGAKEYYLMEPPVDETSNYSFGVLDKAPLNQWKRIATYDTERTCESKRNEAIEASRDETLRLSKTSPPPKVEVFQGAYRDRRLAHESTCVPSDDPRLHQDQRRNRPTGLPSPPPSLFRADDILQ
jgi:hypothetical protein